MTAKQCKARELNWEKVVYKGAIGNLKHGAYMLDMPTSVIESLNKLEADFDEARLRKMKQYGIKEGKKHEQPPLH